MGNTWTIEIWQPDGNGSYEYQEFWKGESAFAAWRAHRRAVKHAKANGYGCVSMKWRG